MHFYTFFSVSTEGMDDVHCGPYPVALLAGAVNASVNISIIDDQDTECDETFTAKIMFGGDGSSTEGFRLGPASNISITVKDNEGDFELRIALYVFCATCGTQHTYFHTVIIN